MKDFEQLLNWMSDKDSEWWPFLFLRPEQHEKMSTLRVLSLAALYGILAGLFVNAVVVASGKSPDSFSPFIFPMGATLGFFLVYRFTFALSWNRRAERLLRGDRD